MTCDTSISELTRVSEDVGMLLTQDLPGLKPGSPELQLHKDKEKSFYCFWFLEGRKKKKQDFSLIWDSAVFLLPPDNYLYCLRLLYQKNFISKEDFSFSTEGNEHQKFSSIKCKSFEVSTVLELRFFWCQKQPRFNKIWILIMTCFSFIITSVWKPKSIDKN